jgi:ubiquinone biosynthesis monooxygenase Coq6
MPQQMAVMTENLNLQRAFLRALDSDSRSRLTIIDKVKVERIVSGSEGSDDWPTLWLSDGSAIRARLLVSVNSRKLS